ncbi:MAG: PQQ-binding-like beta-propeller repeat protein [Thermotogae bacterium]|nr:PQQ-binding-like beta-propeller repeat protein [Thermotogota bacterium]
MKRSIVWLLLMWVTVSCRERGFPPTHSPPNTKAHVEVEWKLTLPFNPTGYPAYLGEDVVILGEGGEVLRLDRAGRWRIIYELGEPPSFGPVINDRRIALGGISGKLVVLDDEGNLLYEDTVDSPIVGATFCEGIFAVTQNGRLLRYSTDTLLWNRYLGDFVVNPPTCVGWGVLVSTLSGRVLAYDSTGNLKWTREGLGTMPLSPAFDGANILVGTSGGEVLRMDTIGFIINTWIIGTQPVGEIVTDGDQIWANTPSGDFLEVKSDTSYEVFSTGRILLTSPIVGKRFIYLVGREYLLWMADGVWDSLEIGDRSWLPPLFVDSVLFLIAQDGTVLRLKVEDSPRCGWTILRGEPGRSGRSLCAFSTL